MMTFWINRQRAAHFNRPRNRFKNLHAESFWSEVLQQLMLRHWRPLGRKLEIIAAITFEFQTPE
jgi:hypothetical protein